jgi:hypothetical protein
VNSHPRSRNISLGEISQAQLVPQSPEDNEKDHISRIFQEVERRSCALIEAVLASRATEHPIAKCCLLGLFFDTGRGAMWAVIKYSISEK